MDEDRPRPGGGGGRAGWRRRLLRPREALAGALLSLLVVASALAAGALAPRDPLAQEVVARLQAPGWSDGEGWTAWLGTDQLGRDILSRLVYGGGGSPLGGVASGG